MNCRTDLLRKFYRLTPPERRVLLYAWLALYLIDLALRLFPFEAVRNWCHSTRSRTQSGLRPSPSFPASRCAWLVNVAGRYSLVEATCLKEALAVAWLMGRRGVATTLKIGVARSNGALTAHAWLEQDGRTVLSRETADAYAPLHPCRHEALK